METNTQKKGVKYLFLGILPFLLYTITMAIIQVIYGAVAGIIYGLKISLEQLTEAERVAKITEFAKSSELNLNAYFVSGLICLVLIILVYFFVFKKRPEKPIVKSAIGIPAIIVLLAGVALSVSTALLIFGKIAPDRNASYGEFMNSTGFLNFSVKSFIASLIFAPLCEELVYRNFTFHFLRNFSGKFWVINIIQAVFFALSHFNPVQMIYAFIIGLVFGYIYNKYNSALASFLAHFTTNLMGTFGIALIFGNVNSIDEVSTTKIIILAIADVVCIVLGILLIKKDKYKANYEAVPAVTEVADEQVAIQ